MRPGSGMALVVFGGLFVSRVVLVFSIVNNIVEIAMDGAGTTCVVDDATFQAKCWGPDTGTGTTPQGLGINLPFVSLGVNRKIVEIAAGYDVICALLDIGEVKCWGYVDLEQVGVGPYGPTIAIGDDLPSLNFGGSIPTTNVTCGTDHVCVRLATETSKCWNRNNAGQLGLGVSVHFVEGLGDALPVLNLGTDVTVSKILAGGDTTCVILGPVPQVKCWGDNSYGQLGIGSTTNIGTDPSQMGDSLASINLGTGMIPLDISLGRDFVCAIVTGNGLKCWGDNYQGQLGQLLNETLIGDTPNELGDNLPLVDLGQNVKVIRISAGGWHICVLTGSNQVKCWGFNSFGQLGLDLSVNNIPSSPDQMGDKLPYLQLGTGYSVLDIQSGDEGSCAILSNRKVKCWGNNDDGQLAVCSTISYGDGEHGQMGDFLPFADDCGLTYSPTTNPTSSNALSTNGLQVSFMTVGIPLIGTASLGGLLFFIQRTLRNNRKNNKIPSVTALPA